ncbi:unnamed protein product, partial [Ascophyllum nodosum]
MVIDVADQVSYCNRTVQVGPHVLVVTCATLDSTVPRLRHKHHGWTLKHGGHTIWKTTESLSSYLVASKVADRRRVLELGAGMGVCGLIAHKTGASSVVLTDGDITTLRYIRQNIEANAPVAGEGKTSESKVEADEQREGEFRPVHARALIWGDKAEVRQLMEVLEMGQFDLVIGSDVIYPESLKKAEALRLQDEKTRQLFVTAAAALREGGTLLLAHQIRYDMKEILAFMEKHATAVGFGPPHAVRIEDSPERVVLSLVFNGKVMTEH